MPEVLGRVDGLVKDWEPMPEALSGREALRDLLRGRSLYDLEAGPVNLAAFNADLLSLPQDTSSSPPLETLLDDSVSMFLEAYQERMLRPVSEREPIIAETKEITPYTDRKLLYNQRSYHRLVADCGGWACSMPRWRPASMWGCSSCGRASAQG